MAKARSRKSIGLRTCNYRLSRALKILRHDAPGVGSTEFADYAQRFQLEAQLGAKLNNQPHVIQVYDFERDGENVILVMEYASGGSLADRIDKARTEQPADSH